MKEKNCRRIWLACLQMDKRCWLKNKECAFMLRSQFLRRLIDMFLRLLSNIGILRWLLNADILDWCLATAVLKWHSTSFIQHSCHILTRKFKPRRIFLMRLPVTQGTLKYVGPYTKPYTYTFFFLFWLFSFCSRPAQRLLSCKEIKFLFDRLCFFL